MSNKISTEALQESPPKKPEADNDSAKDDPPKEIGGRPGPDPTRYGDWEKNGRCIDF